ncbi:hypothetical protein SAMN05216389_11141 [Oceanobacillus limi]|uniref:Phr family secreted Rap phosphatase inhibitor n=1 Tax=Oceanobacillus limi TaxID=930131 RepID=A0A1I0ED79_9BACI|nr:hypothetical protein [Oceanobacillus limi]SET42887.1 hypothetical protein SAMN05216389_11141 [Oceanobacillus limi]
MKKVIAAILTGVLAFGIFGGTVSADPGNPVNEPTSTSYEVETLNTDPGNVVN